MLQVNADSGQRNGSGAEKLDERQRPPLTRHNWRQWIRLFWALVEPRKRMQRALAMMRRAYAATWPVRGRLYRSRRQTPLRRWLE